MRRAWLIGAAACAAASTAAADETYTTFGADWSYSLGWHIIGQTMVIPDEASVLDDFEFVAKIIGESTSYTITVYLWDEEDQHVIGDPLYAELAGIDAGEDQLRHHDIGMLLPPGEKIAVVLQFENDLSAHSVGITGDLFDLGSAIAAGGPIDQPWIIGENTTNDLYFKAEWSVCAADVFADGMLNIFDFLAFQGLYNSGDEKADFNGDGVTNILDFVAFQDAFLNGCGS